MLHVNDIACCGHGCFLLLLIERDFVKHIPIFLPFKPDYCRR
jgi:hypothetical protein